MQSDIFSLTWKTVSNWIMFIECVMRRVEHAHWWKKEKTINTVSTLSFYICSNEVSDIFKDNLLIRRKHSSRNKVIKLYIKKVLIYVEEVIYDYKFSFYSEDMSVSEIKMVILKMKKESQMWFLNMMI